MKNLQNHLNESVITDSSYFSQNNQQKLKKTVFCQFNNNATLLCTNQKCKKLAFICEIKDCECKKQHQFCYELKLQSLLKNIQNKKVFVESLETCINDGVQEIIDMLSIFREETITKMKKDFELFGLSQNEKEFMKEVNVGKFQNVTGSKILQIINSETESGKIIKMLEQTCKSLRSEFQNSKKSFGETIKNTKSTIDKLDTQTDRFLKKKEIPKFKIQKGISLYQQELEIHHSKIMTSLNEFKVIEDFFAPRILKSVKLLYRASQNNFQVKKFHEKCDGIPDTLVLVETEFSKKFGGYTPINWSSNYFGASVSDESMTSFMFSLTEGDKFELKNENNAVKHYSNYGPSFGSRDLLINDKANTNYDSYANINKTYKNQKYKFNKRQSWIRIIGGESYQFKARQWQVWGVEFQ